MSESSQCPACGERYTVSAELAGKRVKCKKCGSSLPAPPGESMATLVTCPHCGASEDLSEKGLRQEDARNMADQLKAVLAD